MSAGTGVGRPFLGLIVLPIAGNAAEHFTAVVVAARGKVDLALAIALGSCVQARQHAPYNVRARTIGPGVKSVQRLEPRGRV